MITIDTISLQNVFSEREKNILNSFIEILLREEDKNIQKDIGIMCLAVATIIGDVEFLRWIVDNEYATLNDVIENRHFHLLNGFGFHFENFIQKANYSKAF